MNALYKHRSPQAAAAIHAVLPADYNVFNAAVGYAVLKNRLTVFVQVDNVFDVSYSDLLGSVMPKRWCMGGVKVQL